MHGLKPGGQRGVHLFRKHRPCLPQCTSTWTWLLAWVFLAQAMPYSPAITPVLAQTSKSESSKEEEARLGEKVTPKTLPGYTRLGISLGGEFGDLLHHDLNADGRKDLLVVETNRDSREIRHALRVYLAVGDEFVPLQSADIDMPPGLVQVVVGEFAQGPELVLLTPGHISLWPWRLDRFMADEGTTLRVDSLFPVTGGGLKTGLVWVKDLNGDGQEEIILPRFDGLGLYMQDEQRELRLERVLKVSAYSRVLHWFRREMMAYQLPTLRFWNADGRGWVDIMAYQDGQLHLFLLDDKPLNSRLDEAEENAPPALARMAPGGAVDAVGAFGVMVQKPQLLVDFQPPTVFDPSKPVDPPLRMVEADDLNGDGLPDLVFSKNTPSDNQFKTRTAIFFYFGKPASEMDAASQDMNPDSPLGYTTKADQVFFSEGLTLPLILDLDADASKDLVMVNVEIGFWNVVKALIARSVTAEAAFYLMPKGGRYPQKPLEIRDYSVKFSLGRYSHQPISGFGDFNGDGLPDLMLSVDKTRLGVHWGRKGGFWNEDPDEEITDYLPAKIQRLGIEDLNGDGRDDLIFLYAREDIRLMPRVNRTLSVHVSTNKAGLEPNPDESGDPGKEKGTGKKPRIATVGVKKDTVIVSMQGMVK